MKVLDNIGLGYKCKIKEVKCKGNTPKYYSTVQRDSTTDELSECERTSDISVHVGK